MYIFIFIYVYVYIHTHTHIYVFSSLRVRADEALLPLLPPLLARRVLYIYIYIYLHMDMYMHVYIYISMSSPHTASVLTRLFCLFFRLSSRVACCSTTGKLLYRLRSKLYTSKKNGLA